MEYWDRRRAVSEVTGSMLMIAITLVAAFAVWGYINSQAQISGLAYASKVGARIGYLEENFVVPEMGWSGTSSVVVWVYNIGSINLQLVEAHLYDSAKTIDLVYSINGGTDYVKDYSAGSTSGCSIVATSYESPTLSSFSLAITNTNTLTLTIPPSSAVPTGQTCNSFGKTLTSGDTYTVVLLGYYGNTVAISRVK